MSARILLSHPLSLSLGSAFFYIALSDFPTYAWPLGFVALIPLFLLIRREQSTRNIFWYGFLFGFVAIAGTTIWFLGAYPLEWAGIESRSVAALIVASVWITTSVFLGVFFALFAWLFKKLSYGDWRDIVTASSLWVLMEYSRALFLSIIFLGSQSSLGPDWILGFFGYSLGWSHLFASFVAPLGGVYLVAFVGVAINYAMFLVVWKFRGKRLSFVCLALVAALSIFYGVDQAAVSRPVSGETKTVAIVTTNFPASFSDGLIVMGTKAASLERLITEAVQNAPDIIVLPEDSRAQEYLGALRVQELLNRSGRDTVLIDSARSSHGSGARAKIFFLSSTGGVPDESAKEFLMPFGEYVPYAAALIARLFGQEEWLMSFDTVRGYERGESQTYRFREHVLGTLFCSEIIPDSPYRNLARRGADIFLNVASHADFHENGEVLYAQTLSTAKMKAAAHRRYFIQAGNHMPSFILNERGEVLAESARGENSVLFSTVRFNTEKTLYTRYGDWMLIVALVLLVGPVWSKRRAISLRRIG